MRFLAMIRLKENTGLVPGEQLIRDMTALVQEAVELTKRFLSIHGDEWDIEIEVRALGGPERGAGVKPSPGRPA